jgi:hypothetical protein
MSHTDDWFYRNEKYDILICIPCGVVIMPGHGGGVSGHLHSSHNGKAENFPLSTIERREILQLHQGRVLNPSPSMPDPEAPPIPHLPVHDGFYCLKCSYVCAAISTIKVHLRNEHGWFKKQGMGMLIALILKLALKARQ